MAHAVPGVYALSPTQLRSDLYRTLDMVADSGAVVVVERHGVKVRISREPVAASRMAGLIPRETLANSPDDLVEHRWPADWGSAL